MNVIHLSLLVLASLYLNFGDGLTAIQSDILRMMVRPFRTRSHNCVVELVESIPENLTYTRDAPKHPSTYCAWNQLMELATKELNIASFYWSLSGPSFNGTSVEEGQSVYNTLLSKAKRLNLTIAKSGAQVPDSELDALTKAGAHVYWVDVARLLGQGILHTKFWTADGQHGYLGSANMDWRSLTQVKELGILMRNCPLLISDLNKIMEVYRLVSGPEGKPPTTWPTRVHTLYNRTNPLVIKISGIQSKVYFTSSPPMFSPPGRTNDLDALLSTIAEAKKYIYISVMSYSPEIVSYNDNIPTVFWPVIDDALRAAVLDRQVEVRLLISQWRYTSVSMKNYLASLRALYGVRGAQIRIRYFVVPSYNKEQAMIPYARVNHNKYMVTDNTAYIGTSNWSGDYFLYTGGTAFVVQEEEDSPTLVDGYNLPEHQPKGIRRQLTEVFYRDWNSEYTLEL